MADDLERRRILLGDDRSFASSSMTNEVSTSLSFTRPASAAFARPAPMLAATSATVTGCSKIFWLPSGSVMTGMRFSKSRGQAACAKRIKQLERRGILPKRGPGRINSDKPRGRLADIGAAGRRVSTASDENTNSKSARPLRFAVVGLGHIAQAAVLPAFKHARPHAELTALVSDTPAKLKQLGRRYGVKHLYSYDDAGDLFASGDIDAVYIALPNTMHAAWTIRAAERRLARAV